MSWVRIDDTMTFHPKIVRAGNAAIGAWVRLCAYSAAHGLDGKVPKEAAKMIASQRELDQLLNTNLIHFINETYEIHDYLDYNPSAADVVVLRDKRKQAGSAGGKQSGETRRERRSNGHSNGHSNGRSNGPATIEANALAQSKHAASTLTNPVPSRPDPVPSELAREYRVDEEAATSRNSAPTEHGEAVGDDPALSADLARARGLMLTWNTIPGAAAFGDQYEFRQVAQAIDRTREAALAARQEFPEDGDVLHALYRTVRKMADDGLPNVWHPKVLARHVSSAVQLFRGERSRTSSAPPSIDDLMRRGGDRGE